MLREVEGFIISETPYGESSKIINVFTKEGVIGIMCKGAKSLKSKNRVSTMRLTYGSFNIYFKKGKWQILFRKYRIKIIDIAIFCGIIT